MALRHLEEAAGPIRMIVSESIDMGLKIIIPIILFNFVNCC